MATILVTGASGFLGSALIPALLGDGHRVVGIARHKGRFLDNAVLKHKNFRFFLFDISNDFTEVLNGIKIDVIYHLASQQPSSSEIGYSEFYAGNVGTTRNVIAYVNAAQVKAVVYASTTALSVTGKKGYINEDSPVAPQNYYTLTKYVAEKMLEIGLARGKTFLTILRLPSLFGKNHLGGIAYTYYTLAKSGKDIILYNGGKPVRNLLYITDAVKALQAIIAVPNRLEKAEYFVAGSKNSLATMAIAQRIKKLLHSRSRIVPVGKKQKNGVDVRIDFSKAGKILNFRPMSIEKGLNCFVKEMGYEI